MLSLGTAAIAGCAQLTPASAPAPRALTSPSAATTETLASERVAIFVATTAAEGNLAGPPAAGLAAHRLPLAGSLALRLQPVRALPELRSASSAAAPELGESALHEAQTQDEGPLDDAAEIENEREDSDDAGSAVASQQPGSTPGEEAVTPGRNELAEVPRGTMVLHVGDSFAGALGVPLGRRLKAAGVRSVLQFKKASYIPTWAFSDELRININRHQPDLVLVSLGANEIEHSKPLQRVYAIRRLVQKLGPRPCVWISPPSWKPDAGLLAVIRENIAPCRYLDSDALVPYLPRGPDSIHPSRRGREIWADAVLEWLLREREPNAAHPWQLREPRTAESSARFQGGFPARRAAEP